MSQSYRLLRSVVEQHTFSKEDLAELAKSAAMRQIIGSMYVGEIGPQTVQWRDDGSIEVFTRHTPADALTKINVSQK